MCSPPALTLVPFRDRSQLETATLSTAEYTIIGVLPQGYHFPVHNLDMLLTGPADDPLIPPRSRELSPFLTVLGRLKPGVSIAQANAEMRLLRGSESIYLG